LPSAQSLKKQSVSEETASTENHQRQANDDQELYEKLHGSARIP
jgi:hypothetical protein